LPRANAVRRSKVHAVGLAVAVRDHEHAGVGRRI
jgi:hypothetical protein